MSPKLEDFLEEWLEWAEADAPRHPAFFAGVGLCNCLKYYNRELLEELEKILDRDFGDHSAYPFGVNEYTVGRNNKSQHRDPRRLTWVRAKLGMKGKLK